MPQATIPRIPDVPRILMRHEKRIRRLEVNRTLVKSGVAVYTIDPPDTAAASWTPDFSSATQVQDTIGCQGETWGLQIPTEWMWWASYVFAINASTPPPTGEALMWSATMDGTFSADDASTFGAFRTDPMFNSSGEGAPEQSFGADVGGATGAYTSGGVILGEASTVMGTEFVPTSAGIAVWAIQLYTESFPHGSGEG